MLIINLLCAVIITQYPGDLSEFDLYGNSIPFRERYIDNINSVQVLCDSLNGHDLRVRLSVINLLTDLADTNSVPALINAFDNEPRIPTGIIDGGMGPKYMILRALGRIGGQLSYAYLKKMFYDLPAHIDSIAASEGDAGTAYYAMFDALARLEPQDSAGLYNKLPSEYHIPDWACEQSYMTYYRLRLKETLNASFHDSLFYILDCYRSCWHKVNPSNYKKHSSREEALRTLILIYGGHDLDMFDKYRGLLPRDDPMRSELRDLRLIAKYKFSNYNSAKAGIEKHRKN
jgi:hypothetical protein